MRGQKGTDTTTTPYAKDARGAEQEMGRAGDGVTAQMGKIKLPHKKNHIKRRTFSSRVLLVFFYLRETLRCVVCSGCERGTGGGRYGDVVR